MTIAQIYEEAKRQLDKGVITIGEFSKIVDREYQEPSKWIPVSERLPEKNGIYIASYEDAVALLKWFNGKWFFYPSNPAREETGTIIAWMPLPEPYKEESKIIQSLAYADQDTLMPAT